MLTGRVPWTASSPAELQRKVQNDPLVYPTRPLISRTLKHLLGRMLDKDPSTRATMQEIKVSFFFFSVVLITQKVGSTYIKIIMIMCQVSVVDTNYLVSN